TNANGKKHDYMKRLSLIPFLSLTMLDFSPTSVIDIKNQAILSNLLAQETCVFYAILYRLQKTKRDKQPLPPWNDLLKDMSSLEFWNTIIKDYEQLYKILQELPVMERFVFLQNIHPELLRKMYFDEKDWDKVSSLLEDKDQFKNIVPGPGYEKREHLPSSTGAYAIKKYEIYNCYGELIRAYQLESGPPPSSEEEDPEYLTELAYASPLEDEPYEGSLSEGSASPAPLSPRYVPPGSFDTEDSGSEADLPFLLPPWVPDFEDFEDSGSESDEETGHIPRPALPHASLFFAGYDSNDEAPPLGPGFSDSEDDALPPPSEDGTSSASEDEEELGFASLLNP
ncbi:MAG: hypothetical protein KAT71_07905, partial [Gammaproteobacteria bacterium]|nr:hypothetical protein [Gammaproteobacteria bacterium]